MLLPHSRRFTDLSCLLLRQPLRHRRQDQLQIRGRSRRPGVVQDAAKIEVVHVVQAHDESKNIVTMSTSFIHGGSLNVHGGELKGGIVFAEPSFSPSVMQLWM